MIRKDLMNTLLTECHRFQSVVVYLWKTSNKYHNCDCTWAKKISSQNLVCFKSLEEAQESGYIPCKVCKPQ